MAKITRIKAKDTPREAEKAPEKAVAAPRKAETKKAPKDTSPAKKREEAPKKTQKSAEKKPFILIRPFVYFGRYVRDSWLEIRQVRWPSRKATWKLVLAVFVYTALFVAIIMLLDALFTWLFGLIIG